MPTLPSQPQGIERVVRAGEVRLYPALARIPVAQRSPMLRAARSTEMDTTERVGVVGSVVVTAYLLQSAGDGSQGLVATSLTQFVLAWPLLAFLVAPWLMRRTRRGLQREADRFNGGDPCSESKGTAQKQVELSTAKQHPSMARRRRS